jgi:hypothetical protein
MIYLISSKFNVVKIGFSSLKYKNVYKRYQTYYGKDISIYCWKIKNSSSSSRLDINIHEDLRSISCGSELYSNKDKNICVDYINSIHGLPTIYYKHNKYSYKLDKYKFKCDECKSSFITEEAYDMHVDSIIHRFVSNWKRVDINRDVSVAKNNLIKEYYK